MPLFSVSPFPTAAPYSAFPFSAMDYSADQIAVLSLPYDALDQVSEPNLCTGLSTGSPLFFRSAYRDLFITFYIAGLAAGWLLPMCDKGAHYFLLEGRSILHFAGLAAGWLLPLLEKDGQYFSSFKLTTITHNTFLHHLSAHFTWFTNFAKWHFSRLLDFVNRFIAIAAEQGQQGPCFPMLVIDFNRLTLMNSRDLISVLCNPTFAPSIPIVTNPTIGAQDFQATELLQETQIPGRRVQIYEDTS